MSMSEELNKLDQLHRQGTLSDAEFERAKAHVIGGGAPGAAPGSGARINTWRRSREDRWIGGVCGGLADLSGVQAWIWRLMFVVTTACAGTGIGVYLLLWFFVPDADRGFDPTRREPA